jgi:hypothetical protein
MMEEKEIPTRILYKCLINEGQQEEQNWDGPTMWKMTSETRVWDWKKAAMNRER